jgi:diamine N-acetyltransferase
MLPIFVVKFIEMQIRRVLMQDAAALSKLGATTFFDTFTGTCTKDDMNTFLYDYFNIAQVEKELANPDDHYYFLEINGDAVGYIRIKEENGGFDNLNKWKALELKRLYVLKEYHGKGVAQLLMNYVFKFAVENNFEVVWLGVWEYNFIAQAFYKKMGFIDTGFKHDFPIGNTPQTDLWYWKFLNNEVSI